MEFLKKMWNFIDEKLGVSKKKNKTVEVVVIESVETSSVVENTIEDKEVEVESVEDAIVDAAEKITGPSCSEENSEMSTISSYIDYLLEQSNQYPDLNSKLLDLKPTLDRDTVEVVKKTSELICSEIRERNKSNIVESVESAIEYIADGKTNISDSQLIIDLSPSPLKVETVKDIKLKSRKSKNKSQNSEQKKSDSKKTEQNKEVKKSTDKPKKNPKTKPNPENKKPL
jgi:hypothetical protein